MIIQNRNFGNDLVLKCNHVDGTHNFGDHLHQFCEIVIVREGEIEITVNGQTHTAVAGYIAVMLPFNVHSFSTPEHVVFLLCVCSNAFFTDFLPFSELCKKRSAAVFHASDALWSYLIDSGFYDNTNTKLHFSPKDDFNYINKLKATFFLILSEYFDSVPAVGDSEMVNTLSKIIIYINQNYDKDLSLESVGTALGYSPKYISNCLNTIPGLGFRTLINSLRIEKAKFLLLSTDKSNTDISFDCGFRSQASFQRVFRELVGTSPQKYRSSRLH